MFQIIGAMAEFERSLIQERVRAGLRNAKLKGKTLGRPPLSLDTERIVRLRSSGPSMRAISAQMDVSPATVHKGAAAAFAKPLAAGLLLPLGND
jgi:DNA invertase Pin-like site-specific DNA recombinase